MVRIFISYSRKYEVFARKLGMSLSNLGADVWIDTEDIPVGMKWSKAVQEGLDVSDILLVIITPESMSSTNVEDEWQYFLDQHKLVIPLLLIPAKVPFQLSRIQYIDFHTQNYDVALSHLQAELKRKGILLDPLAQSSSPLPGTEKPVPLTRDSVSARRTIPLRWLGSGVVLILVISVAIILSQSNSPGVVTPTVTTPLPGTQQAGPTASPVTPSLTLDPTQTLSAADMTDVMATLVVALKTQDAETQAADFTTTATFWTPVGTPNLIQTARALQTATEVAAITTATQAVYTLQTQTANDLTATAILWTLTPTPLPTLSGGGYGQIVYIGRDNHLYLMSVIDPNTRQFTTGPVDASNIRQLTADPVDSESLISWSPDGSQLAYSDSRSIHIIDADGNEILKIDPPPTQHFEDPMWSPDGERIGFSSYSDVNNCSTQGCRDINVMNKDGTNRIQMTDNPHEDRRVAWNPKKPEIAFQSSRLNGNYYIYLMDANCPDTRACEDSIHLWNNQQQFGTFPVWSPDGSQIAFQSNFGTGNLDITLMDLVGNRTILTANTGEDIRPSWSPDGQYIVFQRKAAADDTSGYDLYIIEAKRAGKVIRLTNNAFADVNPAWRPG